MGTIGKIVDVILTNLEQAKSKKSNPRQDWIVMTDQLADSRVRIENLEEELRAEKTRYFNLQGVLACQKK